MYIGRRKENDTEVIYLDGVNPHEQPLNPRTDLFNHSPTGLEWGYNGSGPAQLALAILAHHAGDTIALRHHQQFKQNIVTRLPAEGWTLTKTEVERWLKAIGARE